MLLDRRYHAHAGRYKESVAVLAKADQLSAYSLRFWCRSSEEAGALLTNEGMKVYRAKILKS